MKNKTKRIHTENLPTGNIISKAKQSKCVVKKDEKKLCQCRVIA